MGWRSLRGPQRSRFSSDYSLQHLLKQLINPPIFVGPAAGFPEAVAFEGIHRHLPVGFAEFDEALVEAHDILKVDIGIDHAVADEEMIFQAFGVVDR